MRSWQLAVQLGEDPRLPVFRRIARAIAGDVQRGRLRPGERLPSSRTLSEQLGVNRNTVIAAYDELRALGWIDGERAKGMFVSPAPRGPVAPRARRGEPGFDLPA